MDRDAVDWVSAPADYEELVRRYKTYLINFLRQQGIVEGDREDVFMSILEKAITRDILAQFNPDLTFQHGGTTHRANFKGFITSFFKSYVPGWLVRQNNRLRREPLLCDGAASGAADEGDQSRWIDWHGPVDHDENLGGVEADDLARRFRQHLAGLPPRKGGSSDQLDMLAFFDFRLNEVERTGRVANKDVEQHFGKSHTCVNSWTWRLRQEYCDWAGIPLPAKKSCPPR